MSGACLKLPKQPGFLRPLFTKTGDNDFLVLRLLVLFVCQDAIQNWTTSTLSSCLGQRCITMDKDYIVCAITSYNKEID